MWNVCADVDSDPPCNSFYLLYTRSDANGTAWLTPREVGSERSVTSIDLSIRTYAGTDNGLDTNLASEYAASTRPAAVLDDSRLPYVAWQVAQGQGYVITMTHAVEGNTSSFTWGDGPSPQIGAGSDVCVAPGLMLADPALDDGGVHVTFMKAWLESTGTVAASRAQIYYDYRGMRTRTIEADSPVATRALPQERATIVRARVLDLGGAPVPGVAVTFATDFGSFDFSGSGATSASGTSDVTGWAAVTLYTNLPGTASIDAWLDTSEDGSIDAWEPTVAQSRAWASNVTPAIDVGASWVMAGDLLTATLTNHPYATVEQEGHSTPYVLWWCPGPGAVAVQEEVAGPLTTDIATWSVPDIVIRAPIAAQGDYVLRSYVAGVGADPCDLPDRVAVSAEIAITAAPPPLTPWITVSDDRPAPGASMGTNLISHATGVYGVWWCPAAPGAAPVEVKLANATVAADGATTSLILQVPTGAAGLYRLESHTGSGTCGDVTTRYGLSGLIDPTSRVMLPLVLRNVKP